MRVGLAVALVTLTCTASVAEARPVSPRSGGFEVGASGFVTEQGTEVVAGPQLHLAVRLPAGESFLLGFMGRLGASVGRQTGSVSLIALDARLMLGDLDLAPYASLGLGVLFRAVRDEVDLTDLAQRPDAALPVGLGVETRLTDTLMLGFAARYTAILSDLDRTTGPIDVAAYLVFL
jgi:hypothetical protein